MSVDKAGLLLKFVKIIKDTFNSTPDFFKTAENVKYSYYMKIVDEIGSEVTKFTIGFNKGKMIMSPTYKPDVVITLTDNAFFSLLRGKATLEELYFAGEADLYSNDGHTYSHCIAIKTTFELMEKAIRDKMDVT